ncbi:MAG: class II fructose-bisphosphatase [Anaerolineaceae bacterium]|jgi:fructose-1,6-bisphosphatase II|nr:class II fructose-bisphosphatase [Anaerolineaceae bacterium]MDD4042984.1 class II fructose-bisphosphatase [Anaerolineaceae bacterium]MDD4577521.1 class II fructose-bisphosphatase [Anaerolineaceae bacterium]
MADEQKTDDLRELYKSLSWQLLEVTENAAIAAARAAGQGDKNLADAAAVNAMRTALNRIPGVSCEIKIGEGERDDAPMLFIGEKLGNGKVNIDIAVDPLENTNATANLNSGAVCVLAAAPSGGLINASDTYMDKLCVGKDAADYVDIRLAPEENVNRLAKALKRRDKAELTITVLDRPRNEELISRLRSTGARVRLIMDGDLMPCVFSCFKGVGVHAVMGIGAAPEGVISAAAVKLLGGKMQAIWKARNDADRERLIGMGIDLNRVYTQDDLAPAHDLVFVATAVTPVMTTSKAVLEGVSFFPGGAKTSSLVITRGFMNFVPTTHVLDPTVFEEEKSEFRLY